MVIVGYPARRRDAVDRSGQEVALVWFDSWDDVLRVVLVGAVTYVVLVLMIRIAGKRTLSQLNAFDFVVSVALGSVLATVLLSSDVSFVEGVTALGLLAGLQFLVAAVSSRWPRTRHVVTADPVLLLADGQVRNEALRRNRLTESELRQVVRAQGSGDMSQVKAVVLETDGKFSVITRTQFGSGSALTDVHGAEEL